MSTVYLLEFSSEIAKMSHLHFDNFQNCSKMIVRFPFMFTMEEFKIYVSIKIIIIVSVLGTKPNLLISKKKFRANLIRNWLVPQWLLIDLIHGNHGAKRCQAKRTKYFQCYNNEFMMSRKQNNKI